MKTNNNSNKKNYNRNKSFGDPNSPKRDIKGGNQPARRSVSHDAQTLKQQFAQEETAVDDGFTTIDTKKKSSSRFSNAAAAAAAENNNNSNKNNTPRGRTNPTSSFSRPRPASSFNKPRPTGSFKKGRDGFNKNATTQKSNSFHHGSSSNCTEGGRPRTPNRNSSSGRSQSFSKLRATGSFNSNSKSAKQDKYKRSTSRLTAYDVELYLQGDGKTPEQRNVVRMHVDTMMQARLQHLDPPAFGNTDENNEDEWNPHHKCLWNDPTRRDQIDQVMQQYPNAIPLSMKKRTRIKSSKLGDATTPNMTTTPSVVSTTVAADVGEDNSERDDSSLGTSIRSGIEQPTISDASFIFSDQEDMNPLRKTLLLLNKLSWTTIDKLTPKLFEVLEVDVPKLLQASSPSTPPSSVKDESSVNKTKATAVGGDDLTAASNVPNADSMNDVANTNDNRASSNDEGKKDDPSAANSNDNKPPETPNEPTTVSPMVLTILTLLVEKAQTEPHFSAMYATLCRNLAERNGAWKRKILAHCQTEFEHDIAWHTAQLDEALSKANKPPTMKDTSSNTTATEELDRDYQVLQLRKQYLGHVQFIGELFKLKLIKLDIMIWCLSRLLFHKEEADEDDLQCFAKLMTTVGEQAELLVKKGKCHAVAEEKWHQCWDRVYLLTGQKKQKRSSSAKPQQLESTAATIERTPPKVSSRIKFMLVDLLELKENDWVHRRQHEKPKTIAEIHKEVREEEAEARRRSYSDDWSGFSSFGNRRRINSDDDYTLSPQYHKKPPEVVDVDGFTAISKRSSFVRRAVSDVDVSDIYNKQSSQGSKQQAPVSVPSAASSRSRAVVSQIDDGNATPKIVEYSDPQECKEKTKTIMKEYFVGGDTQEAIDSIDELVGTGSNNEDNGSLDRGAAVIEAGVLLVMEMKQQDVQKFLAVIKRCIQKSMIEKKSLPLGLKDPLEFLSDIEIDAPLARSLLTSIVAYWVRQDALPFEFLLDAPEYFRKDGKPAVFAVGVLKIKGGAVKEEDLSVIANLMTEDDKKKYASAKEMLGPQT